MYQMVIADDEKIIRQGLKNVVDWKELGFEITEMFADGQEIIEYLQYVTPDVILTDIRMRNVSGLEVAKYVFENRIPCKVVLISGFQEFDLAIQGIKYGAEDYLLKPTDVETVIGTFRKLKDQLDEQKVKQEKEQSDRQRMEEAMPIVEERFLSDLILGVVDSEEYIRNRMSLLYPNIDCDHSICMVADLVVSEYHEYMNEIWEYSYDQFEVNISNFLRIYQGEVSFHMVYKSENLLEVFGIFKTEQGEEGMKGLCEEALDQLLQELYDSFRFRATYHMKQIYHNIFEISDFREGLLKREYSEEGMEKQIQEQKKLIMSNISQGNMITAQKLFRSVLQGMGHFSAISRNNVVIDLLSTMNAVIKEVNSKLADSLQSYFNYATVLSLGNKEELGVYCDRIFDRMKLAEEKKEYYDTGSLISKAKKYIADNIHRDISQEEAANQLYICTSYLSRLFKKQTGENFTQYVTRIKMERAIEMLQDPKYKAYQVGEALGYKTPRYFARLFRQHTGMNPSEYRGKVLQVGGEFDENHT